MYINWGFSNNIFMSNSFYGGGCNPFMSCGFNPMNSTGLYNMGMNDGFMAGFMSRMLNSNFFPEASSYNLTPSIFGYGAMNTDFNTNFASSQYNFKSIYPSMDYSNLEQTYNSMPSIDDFLSSSSVDTSYETNRKSTRSDFNNSSKLDKHFLNKTKKVAKAIGCDYEDLLAVMNSESTINPKAQYKNKQGKATAVGLIQFTQIAVDDLNKNYNLNLTLDSIYNMSAENQLDLVQKYYLTAKSRKFPNKEKLTAGDLYAITYLPARAGQSILASRGDKYYTGNAGLDANKDGNITETELSQRVEDKKVNISMFA